RLGGLRAAVTCLAFAPDGTRLAGGLRTGAALVWDVPPGPHRRLPAPALAASRLEELWAGLGGASPSGAHAALWELAAVPGQAVPLLRERLRPVAAVGPRELARLVADLDGRAFAAREAASRTLERLGAQAEPALRQALEGRPSAE